MQGLVDLFRGHLKISLTHFFTVTKGQILETITKWGSTFNVEADITVIKQPNQPKNIFHFTQNLDNTKYGDRIPTVLLLKDGNIRICSAINGDKNFCKGFKYELDTKYHLKIQQFRQNEKTIYNIIMNDNIIYSGENKQPKDFDNVKVYVSDKWYDPFTSEFGLLENLQYDKIRTYPAPG